MPNRNPYHMLVLLAIFQSSFSQRRIKDGYEVTTAKRYMVYLLSAPSAPVRYLGWMCGGTILSKDYVLTSAACVEDVQHMYVVPGYNKYVSSEKLNKDECVIRMKKKVILTCVPKGYHFEYNRTELWSRIDIAVVKVESSFEFNDKSYEKYCSYIPKPIHFNLQKSFPKPGDDVIVLGWGHTQTYRKDKDLVDLNQKILHYAPTKILDGKECVSHFQDNKKLVSIISQSMLCTLERGEVNEKGEPILRSGPGRGCLTRRDKLKGARGKMCERKVRKIYRTKDEKAFDAIIPFDDLRRQMSEEEIGVETITGGDEVETTAPEQEEEIIAPETEVKTTTSGAEVQTTASETVVKTTTIEVQEETAAPDAEAKTSDLESETETMEPEPEVETTISEIEVETTTPKVEVETTAPATELEITTLETEVETTVSETEMETTIPEAEVETAAPEVEVETTPSEAEIKTTKSETGVETATTKADVDNANPEVKVDIASSEGDSPGICQNDHGGPLIAWRGGQEIVVGVATLFKLNKKSECRGPYLFTRTDCNGMFLDCIINHSDSGGPSSERRCNNPGEIGFEIVRRHISWVGHRDGPAENEPILIRHQVPINAFHPGLM